MSCVYIVGGGQGKDECVANLLDGDAGKVGGERSVDSWVFGQVDGIKNIVESDRFPVRPFQTVFQSHRPDFAGAIGSNGGG